jgi:hypothetical protein
VKYDFLLKSQKSKFNGNQPIKTHPDIGMEIDPAPFGDPNYKTMKPILMREY